MLFISPQKLFSFSRYFTPCHDLLDMQITRRGLISKFMTLQPGWEAIAIHILTSTSRNSGNQAIKFGELIGYNTINILFEMSYKKFGGEIIIRSSSEKSKSSISLYCNVINSKIKLIFQTKVLYISDGRCTEFDIYYLILYLF